MQRSGSACSAATFEGISDLSRLPVPASVSSGVVAGEGRPARIDDTIAPVAHHDHHAGDNFDQAHKIKKCRINPRRFPPPAPAIVRTATGDCRSASPAGRAATLA